MIHHSVKGSLIKGWSFEKLPLGTKFVAKVLGLCRKLFSPISSLDPLARSGRAHSHGGQVRRQHR